MLVKVGQLDGPTRAGRSSPGDSVAGRLAAPGCDLPGGPSDTAPGLAPNSASRLPAATLSSLPAGGAGASAGVKPVDDAIQFCSSSPSVRASADSGPGSMLAAFACGILFAVLGVPSLGAEDSDPIRGGITVDPVPGARVADLGSADGLPLTMFRGRKLSYRVIDGMKVHGGDMVLGPVRDEQAVSADVPADGVGVARRELASHAEAYRWPNGRIPYVIDPAILPDQKNRILEAIGEWNARTVITLEARVSEPDYVRFKPVDSGACRADVGMIGGEQGIYIPPSGCTAASMSHEIGHTVGLFHEHQRTDRDRYVMLLDRNLDKLQFDSYTNTHPGTGPYDYSSVMHYDPLSNSSTGGYVMETIPPGIIVSQKRWHGGGLNVTLSYGDVLGVARMYSSPPTSTVLTTNPPGLDVVIDGVRVQTPFAIPWKVGTEHVIEAPSPQGEEGVRYLFGRWGDSLARVRTITTGSDTMWLEANFIEQYRAAVTAVPEGAGTVEVTPPPTDGYYTARTQVTAVATAAPDSGYQFWMWGQTLWGVHGASSNPANSRIDRPGTNFVAVFTQRPMFEVKSTVNPFVVLINGTQRFGPTNLLVDRAGKAVRVRIEDVHTVPSAGLSRFRFEGSIGERHLVLPPQGGAIHANLIPEHPLSTYVSGGGSVLVDPASPDGFYREGTRVRLEALADPGFRFVRWDGDADGTELSIEIELDRPRQIVPIYSQSDGPDYFSESSGLVMAPGMGSVVAGDARAQNRLRSALDATEIAVIFEPEPPGTALDAYVITGLEIAAGPVEAEGRTAVLRAAQPVAARVSPESVALGAGLPPVPDPSATYTFNFARRANSSVRGTLDAVLQRVAEAIPSAVASPRAFTFVSGFGEDPPSQTFSLENHGGRPLDFLIESDSRWLRTVPESGVLLSGESVEIDVLVNSAGELPDTHWGRLTVRRRTAELAIPGFGAEVQVAHIVTPPGDPRDSLR